MGVKAEQLLDCASKTMAGRQVRRDTKHGDRAMGLAVRVFNELFGTELTESQGNVLMVCLKLARHRQGALDSDNFVDGAAYMALAGEAAHNEAFEPKNPFAGVRLQEHDTVPEDLEQ